MLTRLIAAIAICTFLSAPVWAQGNGHGKGKGHSQDAAEDYDGPKHPTIVFTRHDRDIIGRYFQDNYSNLPPGLAKRNGNLPPGLQKHLERDGTLPPGLQKRVQSFPPELERQLPPLPDNYHRVVLGQIAIILDRRTQRIVDIIHDITAPYASH
jgi:hypothetical protein